VEAKHDTGLSICLATHGFGLAVSGLIDHLKPVVPEHRSDLPQHGLLHSFSTQLRRAVMHGANNGEGLIRIQIRGPHQCVGEVIVRDRGIGA
jgi:hypothetical protein